MKQAFVILALTLTAVQAAVADAYRDARAELVAAYQAADFDRMVDAAAKSLEIRPGYPGALFNLALAQVLAGNPEASLATLGLLAGKGVDFGAAEAEEFAPLRELDGWQPYLDTLERLHAPVGHATVAARLDAEDFVPEGIAMDETGDIFLGSIRHGRIVRATAEPRVISDRAGHWSVFGMRFHPDGSLWFASAAVPQLRDAGDDEGRTGLFRLDPASGAITAVAELPRSDDAQVLGDLVIAGDDALLATDSLTGAVYRYDISARRFATLVPPGELGSPQGLVLDQAGAYLYVADYIGGIYRVGLADGGLRRLAVPGHISDYGIDGLYRRGNELIAIRNGSRPHGVIAYRLADDGLAIESARTLAANLEHFDEPTLGFVRGDEFYFVANSHWNRFDRDNALPPDLEGPVVLKISLD